MRVGEPCMIRDLLFKHITNIYEAIFVGAHTGK